MKLSIAICFSALSFLARTQCISCSSVEEANLFPEKVNHLNLKYSRSTNLGSIINRFKNLQSIDLSNSFFMEFNDSIKVETLVYLNLSSSLFKPSEFVKLPTAFPVLRYLDISNSNLNFLPEGIAEMPELQILNLSNNKLSFLPADLENLQQLTNLDLSNNHIKNPSMSLGYLWKLQHLNVSGNPELNLTALLTIISENKALRSLNFDAPLLSSSDGKLLSKLPLKKLTINELSSENQKYIRIMPSLKELELNQISDVDFEILLPKISGLKKLTISNSTLSPTSFKNISIDTLVLKNINSAQADFFTSVKKIKVLDLSNCAIPYDELVKIKQLLTKTQVISNTPRPTESFKNDNATVVGIPRKEMTMNSRDTAVIQEKNATFLIPENAFLLADGSVYDGKVILDVKVYENAIELALDGAPMNYEVNGNNELFGSNGMLYFNATTETGESLRPNPSSIIEVEMRNNIPQSLGDMYLFDSTKQNWSTIPNNKANIFNGGQTLQQIADSINRMDAKEIIPKENNDRRFSLFIKYPKNNLPTIRFDSDFRKKKSTPFVYYDNRANEFGKVFSKQEWVIDTMISQKTMDYLKLLQRQTFKKKKRFDRSPYMPKIIWKLSIKEDYLSDNYRLEFKARDTLISLPIAIKGASNNDIQKSHEKFALKKKQADKKDEKNRQTSEKMYKRHIDKSIAEARKRFIENTIRNMRNNNNNTEMVRFGITGFGLVNCDIIIRVEPDDYIVAEDKLIDQFGNTIYTPSSLRIILIAQNSYLHLERSKPIPLYPSSILLFPIGDEKLGIVSPETITERKLQSIFVYDIKNLSPTEVSQLISNHYVQN